VTDRFGVDTYVRILDEQTEMPAYLIVYQSPTMIGGASCKVERLLQLPIDRCRFNLAIDFCSGRDHFETVHGSHDSWQLIEDNITGILSDAQDEGTVVSFVSLPAE
jgi:hypothetical protein